MYMFLGFMVSTNGIEADQVKIQKESCFQRLKRRLMLSSTIPRYSFVLPEPNTICTLLIIEVFLKYINMSELWIGTHCAHGERTNLHFLEDFSSKKRENLAFRYGW